MLEIDSMFEPAASPFVPFEIVQLDEVYGHAIQLSFQAAGVTVRKLNAGNGRQVSRRKGGTPILMICRVCWNQAASA